MHYCSQRDADVGGCGGGRWGGHSRSRRPGIYCLHTAAAAAAFGAGGGTVKKGGWKSSPAPGNAALEHLISPTRLGSSVFSTVPTFSWGICQHCCPPSSAVLCRAVDNTALHSCGSNPLTWERFRIAISCFFGKCCTIRWLWELPSINILWLF